MSACIALSEIRESTKPIMLSFGPISLLAHVHHPAGVVSVIVFRVIYCWVFENNNKPQCAKVSTNII
jgi:hypothetical protein